MYYVLGVCDRRVGCTDSVDAKFGRLGGALAVGQGSTKRHDGSSIHGTKDKQEGLLRTRALDTAGSRTAMHSFHPARRILRVLPGQLAFEGGFLWEMRYG